MAVFRVERNKGYTVMSNHHLRNRDLTLKARGCCRKCCPCRKIGTIPLLACSISTGKKLTLSAKPSESLNAPDISSVQGNATRKAACAAPNM